MKQNVRGLLAYLFGWIGGLVVLLACKDNDERTKFNACQSIVISGGNTIISIVLRFIPYVGFIASIISILAFILSLVGMIKAYKEQEYEIPVISDLTRNIFSKVLNK